MYKYLLLFTSLLFLNNCKKDEPVLPKNDKTTGFFAKIYLHDEFREDIPFEAPVYFKVEGMDTSFVLESNKDTITSPRIKSGKYKFSTIKPGYGSTDATFEIKEPLSSGKNWLVELHVPKISTTKVENFAVSTERDINNNRIILRYNGNIVVSDKNETEYQTENRRVRVFYSTDPNVSPANYMFTNIITKIVFGSRVPEYIPKDAETKFNLVKGKKLYAVAYGDSNYWYDEYNIGPVNLTCLSSYKSNVAEFIVE